MYRYGLLRTASILYTLKQLRVAITIIYNGLHHLTHKGFCEFMTKNFDYWVVVEGSSRNGGSTSWCKPIKLPHSSEDGTVEFMKDWAARHDNVLFYTHHKHYLSKDEQFNKGIVLLKTVTNKAYLWQVDADEHWTAQDMEMAERRLWRSASNVAAFQFNHYIKEDLIALGDWGSSRVNRLWKWSGQLFESHEPAVMQGQTKPIELDPRFDHYSMVFAQDVKFKSRYYRGHEMIYLNWCKLDDRNDYPIHISNLFGKHCEVGRSDSYLYKITDSCVNVPNHASQNADIKC